VADAVAVEPPPQEMAILAAEVAAEEGDMIIAAAEEVVAAEEGDMILAAEEVDAAEEGNMILAAEEVDAAVGEEKLPEDVGEELTGAVEEEGTNKFIYFLLF
jgi:hypothetical protein